MARRLVQATANLKGFGAGKHRWVDTDDPRVVKLLAGGWLEISGYEPREPAPEPAPDEPTPEPFQFAHGTHSEAQEALDYDA